MYASIIIPTYSRASYLRDAVESLRQQVFNGEFEIIVVDNASSRELQAYVASLNKKRQPIVHYVAEIRPGLHNARHSGARAAQSEILVYVDDDILAHPGWIKAILLPYQDPSVACVGGRVIPHWEAALPSWLSEFPPSIYSLLDHGDEERELPEGDYIYGCNFSIRKQVLYEVGGFNPDGFGARKLIWYRGDGECGLQRKVRAAGKKVVYTPAAVIEHRIPARRLSLEYLYRRAFDAGIEGSYVYYRYRQPTRFSLLMQVGRTVARIAYRCLRRQLNHWSGRSIQELKESVVVANKLGRLSHLWRLFIRAELRRYCLRVSYFD